jgi:hypothetical protein
VILALLVVLAACGSSSASSAPPQPTATQPAGGHGSCGPANANTLAANGRVRVYALHQAVFGCSAARRHSFRLGHATRSIGEDEVGPVAVAGDLAAYGLRRFGVDTALASVVVRRLTDGTTLKELSATRALGAESFQSVESVVIRRDGAVAWIGSVHSIGARRSAIEVHEAGTGGDRLLDSGSGIDAGSLRLHGSTLSWVDGGATRHATLQ